MWEVLIIILAVLAVSLGMFLLGVIIGLGARAIWEAWRR